MKLRILNPGITLALLLVSAGLGFADNVTPATARSIAMNSTAQDNLQSGSRTSVWYKVQMFAGRSYQISVWTVREDGVFVNIDPVELYSDAAGAVLVSAGVTTTDSAFEGSPNDANLGPKTTIFQPTATGLYLIHAGTDTLALANTKVNIRVRETTLFSPWLSKAAGFEGFLELHNNTSAAVSVTVKAYNSAGVLQGAGLTFSIPANATVFQTGASIGVPVGVAAGVVLTHNGAFGAISGNITTLNGANGLSFDSPFTVRDPGGAGGGDASAASDTLAALSCASTQVAKWNGAAWACAADVDTNSGGTVTSVTAGSGLSGGAITSTGTVAVASGGITSAMIANGAVGSAQIDATQVQTRVSATCPAGSTIQQISSNGTVVCQTAASQPAFSTTTLDGIGIVGYYSSMTIGTDGLSLISYQDGTNGDLKVAHCSNTACSAATTAILDSTGDVGYDTSITIGTDGLGLISYYDNTNLDLKVAHCSNTACSAATTATLDSIGIVGYSTSITIGADGLGLISYYDNTNLDLKVAHCSNTACSAATTATLDSTGDVGYFTSITIGSDGLGLISYYDNTNHDLKVGYCSNTACSAATTATLDSPGDVGHFSSITIGTDGLGLISYYDNTNHDLKVAHCSNQACSAANTATLDSPGTVGDYSSITIGTDGLGLISYYDSTNLDLKVAHCSNQACSAATNTNFFSPGQVGWFTSITIGMDGLGLISYFDLTNGDLKVAHCSTAVCSPYVRRR